MQKQTTMTRCGEELNVLGARVSARQPPLGPFFVSGPTTPLIRPIQATRWLRDFHHINHTMAYNRRRWPHLTHAREAPSAPKYICNACNSRYAADGTCAHGRYFMGTEDMTEHAESGYHQLRVRAAPCVCVHVYAARVRVGLMETTFVWGASQTVFLARNTITPA